MKSVFKLDNEFLKAETNIKDFLTPKLYFIGAEILLFMFF